MRCSISNERGSESLVVRGGMQTFAHDGLAEGETGDSVAQAVKVSEATMVEWHWDLGAVRTSSGLAPCLAGIVGQIPEPGAPSCSRLSCEDYSVVNA
jgi:hypothetical protein